MSEPVHPSSMVIELIPGEEESKDRVPWPMLATCPPIDTGNADPTPELWSLLNAY